MQLRSTDMAGLSLGKQEASELASLPEVGLHVEHSELSAFEHNDVLRPNATFALAGWRDRRRKAASDCWRMFVSLLRRESPLLLATDSGSETNDNFAL